ncbi:Hypothetical protein R9X50_00719900 [Acrodontium crateriforme]|uniref:Metal homeostatis protein bsd2 n=1 Tax=Acrodontium crateriforme TaxID=150365 RepID=A0AAQ3MAZ7_9PEZI|nr:Hypothetical protein R9X50_00719900 [Acrodontium crateriforme]
MSSHRYQAVSTSNDVCLVATRPLALSYTTTNANKFAPQVTDHDTDDHVASQPPVPIPNSPPPSFRSRASSRRTSRENSRENEEAQDLNDAFDAPSDEEDDDQNSRDRRRLMPDNDSPTARSRAASDSSTQSERPTGPLRATIQIPVFEPAAPSGRAVGSASDGVFANIAAKPQAGDDLEEKPPTYEQAAADATPPYWETTVLSPYATSGDPNDVFVDGLLVGSIFSFVWNALISMSFQLIGFLLTYLLHTTHAAKHGSRAGLGITLVQYGFQMRYATSKASDPAPSVPTDGIPDDPNGHNFNPDEIVGSGSTGSSGTHTADWLAYVLMIVGWFILIRACSDFIRARRQEALVRSSPDRGLGVAVVAEGEHPESSV